MKYINREAVCHRMISIVARFVIAKSCTLTFGQFAKLGFFSSESYNIVTEEIHVFFRLHRRVRKALDLKVYFKVIVSPVLSILPLRCMNENVN